MNFDDTPSEAAYRAAARAWLDDNARRRQPGDLSDHYADPTARLAAARRWQGLRAEGGYACITWPKEWGGAGGTAIERVIFDQEEANYVVPPMREFFEIGLGFCLPTVAKFAPEEQVMRFLAPALRGEEIWCQLFSEPAAGSDLAGLTTRASRDGDDWLIEGQKVWTTGAQIADFGLLLARTDPDALKHRGLTMFWVDMRAAGVEVRPIRQMEDSFHFNEVFFSGARIADAQRLGAVGEGWKVALVTLMNERFSGGALVGPNLAEILALADDLPGPNGEVLSRDARFRELVTDWYVRSEGVKLTRFRTMTALSRGDTPGPESSIGKLVLANEMLDVARSAVEAQHQFGLIDDSERSPMRGLFQRSLLHMPSIRIAGGTDEILRNIIAERVLGLPGDPRNDRDVPFRDIPTGV